MSDAYFAGLQFLVTQHILGIIMPGPCMAIVIRQSIDDRWKGLKTVIGSVLGSFSVKTLSVLGLALILQQMPSLFNIVKILGGSYLLFLGWVSFRHSYFDWKHFKKSQKPGFIEPLPQASAPILRVFKNLTNPLMIGYLISFSNPLSSVRFIALFATAISADMPLSLQLSYLLVLALISLIMFGAIALFFSTEQIQHVLQRYRFVLNGFLGCTMAYWGCKVFQVTL